MRIIVHQHDIATFQECRKRFDLSFNQHIFPRIQKKFIEVGSLFSKSVYYLHKGTPIENCLAYIEQKAEELKLSAVNQERINEIEEDKVTVVAMLNGYNEKFMSQNVEIIPEYNIKVPIKRKYIYSMTLDGRIKTYQKDNWILEIKTTASIEKDQITRLPCDFQIKSYAWGLQKWAHKPVKGVLYRFIRKPSIKQKQTETIDQYLKRLMLDYINRKDFYFYEEMPLLDQNIISDFDNEIYQMFDDLNACYKTNNWYKSPLCGKTRYGICPYFQYCSNPIEETLETFYEMRTE